jgi:hypothetical protein
MKGTQLRREKTGFGVGVFNSGNRDRERYDFQMPNGEMGALKPPPSDFAEPYALWLTELIARKASELLGGMEKCHRA